MGLLVPHMAQTIAAHVDHVGRDLIMAISSLHVMTEREYKYPGKNHVERIPGRPMSTSAP